MGMSVLKSSIHLIPELIDPEEQNKNQVSGDYQREEIKSISSGDCLPTQSQINSKQHCHTKLSMHLQDSSTQHYVDVLKFLFLIPFQMKQCGLGDRGKRVSRLRSIWAAY